MDKTHSPTTTPQSQDRFFVPCTVSWIRSCGYDHPRIRETKTPKPERGTERRVWSSRISGGVRAVR
jgi:hypothetical protein